MACVGVCPGLLGACWGCHAGIDDGGGVAVLFVVVSGVLGVEGAGLMVLMWCLGYHRSSTEG